jgi:uncharacterized protein with ACT and thioredoxin-like domain
MSKYILTEVDKKGQENYINLEFKSAEQAEEVINKIKSIDVKEYIPDSNETIDSKFRIYKMP